MKSFTTIVTNYSKYVHYIGFVDTSFKSFFCYLTIYSFNGLSILHEVDRQILQRATIKIDFQMISSRQVESFADFPYKTI